ncbi:MAG: helix-turn-helix domain-containing protein [Flavobacteriales bacterium]|nr:helix-turn-helix domain-containing protein [Flavobacteriales bacterium]
MKNGAIPTHHLAERSRTFMRVEQIRPKAALSKTAVHRHDFHELLFIATGSGRHMLDLQPHAVTSPCVHLVSPGQVHQLERSADMSGMVVMFSPHALLGQGQAARAELFALADRPSAIALTPSQLEESAAIIHLMQQELALAEPMLDAVEGYLGILLIKCARWSRDLRSGLVELRDSNDPVRRFFDLVERGYLEQRQVGHYAEQLAMSGDHLNELVRERSGRTASSVIQERLLLEAKRLLLHGDMSIKEVGYALNMKDPAYFTRWFSKVAGSAPAAFREEIRDKYKA